MARIAYAGPPALAYQRFHVRDYGAVGSGDETSAIQACIDAAAGVVGQNIGGGEIEFEDRVYQTGTLRGKQHVRLRGNGVSTILSAVAGIGGPLLVTDAQDVRFLEISNMRLMGNDEVGATGIWIDCDDLPSPDEYADGLWRIENVFIQNFGLDGIFATGRGEGMLTGFRIRDCGRYGLNMEAVDNDVFGGMIGGCGSAGIRDAGANNRYGHTKTFYCGLTDGANGHGWWLDGSTGGHTISLTNCEAQDNNHHGLFVDGFGYAQVHNFVADSNNAGHNGDIQRNANGVHLHNAYGCRIKGMARNRAANTRNQQHALGISGWIDSSEIDLISDGNEVGHFSGSYPWGVTIEVNNSRGQQEGTYAATFAPDPTLGSVIRVALTGNVVVNQPIAGTRFLHDLTFVFVQDATGGRTITFDSNYTLSSWTPDTSPNAVSSIAFRHDGYTFVQVG